MQNNLFIGLMSGTSADGVDLALVDFDHLPHKLVASSYLPYPDSLKQMITSLYVSGSEEIDRSGQLDKALAMFFANAISQFLTEQSLTKDDITAIGNHGQTIRHRPNGNYAFTLQIGCSQTLACLTGIRVIGKFRDKDIALGGQGAPLVPAYHQAIFSQHKRDVCVINIGGIANITYLPADENNKVVGFDTGPGNALLDDWYRLNHTADNQGIDLNGDWAKTGTVNDTLLTELLSDDYFFKSFPKSTGREYFHMQWLQHHIENKALAAEDVQATLLALTAHSIANTVQQLSKSSVVILCGGGANNPHLVQLITQLCDGHDIDFTDKYGVDNESLEAMVFAWLAFAYINKLPGNLPEVTGASKSCILGLSFRP